MSRSRKPGARAYSAEWRERVSQGLRRANAARRERARVLSTDLERWRERGLVAEALRPVVELAQREALDVAQALGGSEGMSAQRRVLLADFARLGTALGGLVARYLQTEDPDLASRIATVANARRQHLQALGLDERHEEVDLQQYLAARQAAAAPAGEQLGASLPADAPNQNPALSNPQHAALLSAQDGAQETINDE